MGISVRDFIDGILTTTSVSIPSMAMREFLNRAIAIIVPTLDTSSALLLREAQRMKFGDKAGTNEL